VNSYSNTFSTAWSKMELASNGCGGCGSRPIASSAGNKAVAWGAEMPPGEARELHGSPHRQILAACGAADRSATP